MKFLVRMLPAALAAASASNFAAAQTDEVVVTATRRETHLLDTPISMTVIGGDDLQATGADGFSDFARRVPGLTAIDSGPGNQRYALRGLQSAGEPEVGLYYDDFPITGLPGGSLDTGDRQPDISLWDIDRIEVLRGPQGTLWDYEVGWKAAFADRSLTWTGALFRIDWSHLQQLMPTSVFSYIVNAGSARSDGFETQIEARVYPGLALEAGASLANAHLIGPQPLSRASDSRSTICAIASYRSRPRRSTPT